MFKEKLISKTKDCCFAAAGFTLIELLLVIVIIGIMLGIGGGYYLTSLKKGSDGKRAGDLNNLRNALEMYYLDQDPVTYPDTGGNWETVTSGNALDTALVQGTDRYLQVLPADPKSGSQDYRYKGIDCTSGICSCYCLSAKMQVEENERLTIGSCTCPSAHSDECYLVTCP